MSMANYSSNTVVGAKQGKHPQIFNERHQGGKCSQKMVFKYAEFTMNYVRVSTLHSGSYLRDEKAQYITEDME